MNEQASTAGQETSSVSSNSNTVTFQIPKINAQVAVLAIIALIAVLQAYQLTQISAKASTATVKAVPATDGTATVNNAASGGSVPEAMVGGC